MTKRGSAVTMFLCGYGLLTGAWIFWPPSNSTLHLLAFALYALLAVCLAVEITELILALVMERTSPTVDSCVIPRLRTPCVVLENIPAQVLIFDDLCERALDVSRVDHLAFDFKVWGVEADLVQDLLHNRVQAARADVFGLFVDAAGELRDRINRIYS